MVYLVEDYMFRSIMLFNTPLVGDITIEYDPPRRGRAIPLAVHNDKAHEDVEDGGSRSRLTKGPKPTRRLEAHRCKPPYMYDLYCKACGVSHRAGHVVYEPAGTP